MKKTLPALVLVLSTLVSLAVFGRPTEARIFTSPTLKVWYQDSDNDGYGNVDVKKRQTLKPVGYVSDKTDCDDSHSNAYPGATEIWYNGVDNDCSGGSDYDQDGDGWGKNTYYFWDTEYTSYFRDCNDTSSDVSPSATEIDENAIDEDCDGESIIETYSDPIWACWYQDTDYDGYGDPESLDSSFDCEWSYSNRSVWWLDSGDVFWSFQVNDEGQDCDDSDDSVYPGTSTC